MTSHRGTPSPLVAILLHLSPLLFPSCRPTTVEPLLNDDPLQRPSVLYDPILCDGQCFLFVRSLTNDHPSDATNDRSDEIISLANDHLAYRVFPRIAGDGSTSVPNHVLLQCCA